MNGNCDESLDDRIDRVARELTRVPPNAAFTGQLRARIDVGRGRAALATPAFVAASVFVGVVVLAMVLWTPAPRSTDEAGRPTPDLVGRAFSPIAPLRLSVPRTQLVPATAPTRVAAPLDIAPLTIEALELATLAEVEPLHVDDIQVTEIETRDMKEPR